MQIWKHVLANNLVYTHCKDSIQNVPPSASRGSCYPSSVISHCQDSLLKLDIHYKGNDFACCYQTPSPPLESHQPSASHLNSPTSKHFSHYKLPQPTLKVCHAQGCPPLTSTKHQQPEPASDDDMPQTKSLLSTPVCSQYNPPSSLPHHSNFLRRVLVSHWLHSLLRRLQTRIVIGSLNKVLCLVFIRDGRCFIFSYYLMSNNIVL